MSFSLFLNEGLIKLPEKLRKELHTFFLEAYFSYLFYHSMQQSEDSLDEKLFTSIFKQLSAKYGVKQADLNRGKKLSTQNTTSASFETEIPESYLAALARAKKNTPFNNLGMHKKAKFQIVFRGNSGLGSNNRGAYFVSSNKIAISIQALNLSYDYSMVDFVMTSNIKAITKRIDEALNTIDHELTHLVQFIALRDLHGDQVVGTDPKHLSRSADDRDLYYASQLEMDPWIRNSINELTSKTEWKQASDSEKKNLLKTFVWSDLSVDEIKKIERYQSGRSISYRALRLQKPSKWKRAVKILFQTLLP